jgi:hypothetical protein
MQWDNTQKITEYWHKLWIHPSSEDMRSFSLMLICMLSKQNTIVFLVQKGQMLPKMRHKTPYGDQRVIVFLFMINNQTFFLFCLSCSGLFFFNTFLQQQTQPGVKPNK